MGVLFPKISDDSRIILIHQADPRLNGNKIDTAKYSIATFLPKSLLLQFTRLSNVVFLANAILQSIPIISTISPITAIGPLAFVLSLSMIREGYEDYKRHKKDWEINSRKTHVLRNGSFEEVEWDQLRPGDFVNILSGELIPADTLLLTSSSEAGICYVETSNLDGESNLKEKRTVAEVGQLTPAQLNCLRGIVTLEKPSPNLYQFSGKAEIQRRDTIYLQYCSLLLRETVLKNTESVVGLVLYCGHDTKILRNQGNIHHKMSNIEMQVNYIQGALIILLVLLCACSSVGYQAVNAHFNLRENNSYVPQTGFTLSSQSFLMFFTIFLLLNFLIPITLNILIEGIKSFSALFLYLDQKMYDKTLKHHCGVLNSSIVEQLGLIDCVLTDKTGTLTANQMVFQKIAVENKTYKRDFIEENVKELVKDHNFHELIRAMALCHDVVRDQKRQEFQGSSPDEVCFVDFASSIGFNFQSRNRHAVILDVLGVQQKFQLIEILPFSSRKRMSVIVKDPTTKNQIIMYTKGADSAIFEKAHWYTESQTFNYNIDVFAKEGLRTLVFAKRIFTGRELKLYLASKESIKMQTRERLISKEEAQQKEKELIEKLESNLEIIGATGIEDRLQDYVPQTLSRLQAAHIKVMMITGDKLETAENIGYLSHLIKQDYRVYRLSADIEDVKNYLQYIRNQAIDGLPFTILIEGRHIAELMQPAHPSRHLFAYLLTRSKSVIFCRSSPREKAVIVRFVKEELNLIVLAIGDGGNDVGMIQEAHIGVGILGKQGNSAATVSDFSIGQFHFLDRLVLHHGRWFYYRLSYFFVFFGLKNMIITVVIFLYLIDCAYSGSLVYTQLFYLLYNCFIGISMLVNYGLYDQDANDDLEPALWHHLPLLYWQTKQKKLFSYWRYVIWSVIAVIIAVLIYYVIKLSLLQVPGGLDGFAPDLMTARIANGIALNIIILVLNYMDTSSHTAFFTYFVFGVASVLATASYFIAENYMELLGLRLIYTDNFNIRFCSTILLIVGIVYACKLAYQYMMVELYPSTLDLYKLAAAQDQQRKEEIFIEMLRESQKTEKQEQQKGRQWCSNTHNVTTETLDDCKKYRSAHITVHNTEECFNEEAI